MNPKSFDTPLRLIGHQNGRPTNRKETPDELEKWLPMLNTRADLTLKQAVVTSAKGAPRTYRRLQISEDIIATMIRAMNRLNRYVWKTERRERRITAICFWERGRVDGRAHVHALLERPAHVSVDEFEASIRRAWTARPFGYRVMEIEPMKWLRRSLNYNTKQGIERLIYIHRDDPKENA